MRNYFNARVAYHNTPDRPCEIIIKVGEVNPEDDMYVDEYVSSQEKLKTIKNKGHPEFTLLEYWKEPRPLVEEIESPILEPLKTIIANDVRDWLTESGEYSENNNAIDDFCL